MAVIVHTGNSHTLLEGIRFAIENGEISAWELDEDGDLTLTQSKWRYKAWLHPKPESNRLLFTMIPRSEKNVTIVEYAVYHARLVEMLLVHFEDDCSSVYCTSQPDHGDSLG